jgi:hypothetical protein
VSQYISLEGMWINGTVGTEGRWIDGQLELRAGGQVDSTEVRQIWTAGTELTTITPSEPPHLLN